MKKIWKCSAKWSMKPQPWMLSVGEVLSRGICHRVTSTVIHVAFSKVICLAYMQTCIVACFWLMKPKQRSLYLLDSLVFFQPYVIYDNTQDIQDNVKQLSAFYLTVTQFCLSHIMVLFLFVPSLQDFGNWVSIKSYL